MGSNGEGPGDNPGPLTPQQIAEHGASQCAPPGPPNQIDMVINNNAADEDMIGRTAAWRLEKTHVGPGG